ncbi:MAG: YbjN domain-containing protein [Micropepsaceae bacterium]
MPGVRKLVLIAAAAALCGLAVAQDGTAPPPEAVAPTAAPPEAAAPAPAETGLITAVSFEDVKAVFAGAGVPFEVKQLKSGRNYILGQPNGWVMFVYVMNCDDDAALTGCKAISLESGDFVKKVDLSFVNAFNAQNVVSHAVLLEGGQSYTKFGLLLHSGVSPTYLRDAFRMFVNEMSFYADELQKAGAEPPKPTGTFGAGAGLTERSQTLSPRENASMSLSSGDAGVVFGK